MRQTTKSLSWPLAGVSRAGSYRQQTRPYSAPWAYNVRTFGPSESRRRGGSRPGLAKYSETDLGQSVTTLLPISYVDQGGTRRYDLIYVLADGTIGYMRLGVNNTSVAELETDAGVDITANDDVTMDFSATLSSGTVEGTVRGGKVYLIDSVLKTYDPATGAVETVAATTSQPVPTGQSLVATYRDRIVMSGANHVWYASRIGDPGDWDFGADFADTSAAVAGQAADAGTVGEAITALIPVHDSHLVIATARQLWVVNGDPRAGQIRPVSMRVGVVGPRAWAMDPDGTVVFLSHDGVYSYRAGSLEAPKRFSEQRVPDELREVSVSTNTVSMSYDPVERGFNLFVTPAATATAGTHWWIDLESRAIWPQRFSVNTLQPLATCTLDEAGLGDCLVAGSDGYIRSFSSATATDDGNPINSHVLIGPVRLAADDVRDAMLTEVNGVVENLSGDDQTVTWRVVMGKSAAQAAELAKADLDLVIDGQSPVSVDGSGTWTEGRNRVSRPRSRGAWAVVWLSSTAAWSYEVVATVGQQLGRHR